MFASQNLESQNQLPLEVVGKITKAQYNAAKALLTCHR